MQKDWRGWGGNVIFWRVRHAHYQDHSIMHFAREKKPGRICSFELVGESMLVWWPRAWGLNASLFAWTECNLTLAGWTLPSGRSRAITTMFWCLFWYNDMWEYESYIMYYSTLPKDISVGGQWLGTVAYFNTRCNTLGNPGWPTAHFQLRDAL